MLTSKSPSLYHFFAFWQSRNGKASLCLVKPTILFPVAKPSTWHSNKSLKIYRLDNLAMILMFDAVNQ